MRLSAWRRPMPACSVQNSSQVRPRESSMWESRTCLRHWARAAEQLPETAAKAFWRPVQERGRTVFRYPCAFFETIVPRLGEALLQTRELAVAVRNDRSETGLSAGCP